MKASDLLAVSLADAGISHAFGVQGGAVVHIFDSLESTPISVTYSVFEHSAALAAVAASRVAEHPQLCVVTTGPGGTNAITGLLAAWQDSVPVVFVSGQARTTQLSYGSGLRQVGSQEAPILDIVRPITKSAVLVRDASQLREVVRASLQTATSGRPGPVWIDIPVDCQWGPVDDELCRQPLQSTSRVEAVVASSSLRRLRELIEESREPLFWFGAGIRPAVGEAKAFVESSGVPFVTTWQTKEILGPNHPLDLGVIGPFGQRGANLATYKADLIVAFGSHFGLNHTTGNVKGFCPQAKKVVIDIDEQELAAVRMPVELAIHGDCGTVLRELATRRVLGVSWDPSQIRLFQGRNRVDDQREQLESLAGPRVNSNVFLADVFFDPMPSYDVVIDGGGTALYAGWQCHYGTGLNRLIGSTAISSMGTALAETVGVQAISHATKTFVVIGDGSLWMSLHDLPPLAQLQKPVVVVVVNNGGYLAIRHTQREFLGARYRGTDEEGGLPLPDIAPVAQALGFTYTQVTSQNQRDAVRLAREHDRGVLLIELMCPEDQELLFSQVFKANSDGTKSPLPLSSMAPLA